MSHRDDPYFVSRFDEIVETAAQWCHHQEVNALYRLAWALKAELDAYKEREARLREIVSGEG